MMRAKTPEHVALLIIFGGNKSQRRVMVVLSQITHSGSRFTVNPV
jgi:hypothetical protein